MTTFFNKFKKTCFWPSLSPLSQFWGQKNFPENPNLSHTTLYEFLKQHAKLQKKLLMQFQENSQTERAFNQANNTIFFTR